jgi:hypothetical protein
MERRLHMQRQARTATFTLDGLEGREARKAVRDWVPTCTSPRGHVRQVGKDKLSAHLACTHKPGKRVVA